MFFFFFLNRFYFNIINSKHFEGGKLYYLQVTFMIDKKFLNTEWLTMKNNLI